MPEVTLPVSQISQVPTSKDPEQQGMSFAKGITIILIFAVLFAATGLFIGKKFFWNNYSNETQIQHELKMNQENVKNDANNPNNHLNLGWTYLKMGENEQAVGEFKKTLALDPKNYGANLNLGLAYVNLEQYDRAISSLKDAISIESQTYLPHLNLAVSYYHVGRYDDALNELDIAYKNNPGTPDTMYVRGMVYEKQNKLQQALDEYSTALSFNPKDQKVQAAVDRVKKALNQ